MHTMFITLDRYNSILFNSSISGCELEAAKDKIKLLKEITYYVKNNSLDNEVRYLTIRPFDR